MTDLFDLVVVGGGFAGLVCARTAALRGMRVAVVERRPEPGAAVHTTGILVKEAADALDVPRNLTRKVRGIRLYSPSLRSVDLDSPGYYFLATDTPELLRWLAAETEAAGAHIYYGCAFDGAGRDGDRIVLGNPAIAGRYLVGADGARSRVAECFGLGRNRHMLVGLEAEYEGVRSIDGDRLHCFVDSKIAPGYIGWAVPGVGVTQIGLACRRADKPNLARLVDKLSGMFDLSSARIVARRSGPIPVGGPVRPFAGDRVMLIGDAAGLVSPLTAGGVHPAFHFGRRAAQAISDHLFDAGLDPARVLATEYPRYRWKGALRRLLDLGPPNWLFDATLHLPPARVAARLIYFHRKGLGSSEAWRDLLRRH